MDILISNLLSESILDFGKWSNLKYMYTCIRVFSVWPLPEVQNFCSKSLGQYLKKSQKIDFPLYFKVLRIFKRLTMGVLEFLVHIL